MSRADRVVVLFAKWPDRGRAKQRLARAIGRDRAQLLARSFLLDMLSLIDRSGADRVVIAYAPPAARLRFARCAPHARLVAQPRAGFGRRLQSAIDAGLAVGRHVVLVGADSPTLPSAHMRRAFAHLAHADLALGPTADGGYYLIATRARLPSTLFARMPWSTALVTRETLRRSAEAGLRVAILPEWYDLDDVVGLRRLVRDRAGLTRARATRRTLDALGMLR